MKKRLKNKLNLIFPGKTSTKKQDYADIIMKTRVNTWANYCFSLIALPPAEVDKGYTKRKFQKGISSNSRSSAARKLIVMTGIDPKGLF